MIQKSVSKAKNVDVGVDTAANGPPKALTPAWRTLARSRPRRGLWLMAYRYRELELVSRDPECNLQLPSERRVTEYATTCACTPEPRNGVRADGTGRL